MAWIRTFKGNHTTAAFKSIHYVRERHLSIDLSDHIVAEVSTVDVGLGEVASEEGNTEGVGVDGNEAGHEDAGVDIEAAGGPGTKGVP